MIFMRAESVFRIAGQSRTGPNTMGETSSSTPLAAKAAADTPSGRKALRPLVLLVDDESSNLQLLIEALRSDYEVAVANRGKAALQFLSAGEKPAIILLDIMMPEMDGYEVCHRLKSNPDTRSIPVIFITALTDVASEEHGFELGAVDYIHKPLKVALVRARVRTHMTIRGMLDQLFNTNAELNEKITDLDRTNRTLDQTASELQFARSRQELFARIFASTAEGIIVANAEGQVEAVNRAFIRITGYSSEEAVNQNHYFLKSGLHAADFYREISRRLHDSGHWSGEMLNRRKNGEIYPELRTISAVYDDEGRVSHFVSVFSDVSGIKQTQERIDFLTWHDSLTQLPNRMLYLDRLDVALRSCRSSTTHTAAMVLDIDGFKAINDAQGLQTGDSVLCEVGRRIAIVLRSDDTVARLAADEFAILLFPRQQSLADVTSHALLIAEAIRSALAHALECGGQTFLLTCSIGIRVFPANTDETPLQVLQSADTARHRAMLDGGNRVVFFEESMAWQARQHFELAQALQAAIEQNQLRLYLQPQVNGSGVVVGAESLVRWEHPQRGLILPAEFIPVAEESRLIVALDRWMLRRSCELIAEMQRNACPLRISVNISPRHFIEAGFVDDIQRLLESSAINPSLLMLEVTESLMIRNMDDVVAKMKTISAMGVCFSIDDFGTGYSSLAYLKRLPIHELKIDQSFIRDAPADANDALLVAMIQSIATILNIETVAEGVETREHSEFLTRFPGLIQQGYLHGRPQPGTAWVKKRLEQSRTSSHAGH
tara:strand:+ start:83240 stop:85564 length:2325 start_codon:yes stop_codon:yes gene_type:complete